MTSIRTMASQDDRNGVSSPIDGHLDPAMVRLVVLFFRFVLAHAEGTADRTDGGATSGDSALDAILNGLGGVDLNSGGGPSSPLGPVADAMGEGVTMMAPILTPPAQSGSGGWAAAAAPLLAPQYTFSRE